MLMVCWVKVARNLAIISCYCPFNGFNISGRKCRRLMVCGGQG
jgi:hypothetical protein